TLNLDAPKQNEVLIKIHAAGLCHSDLSVINGSRPRPMPMALGHEAAGEIIKLGEGVSDFEIETMLSEPLSLVAVNVYHVVKEDLHYVKMVQLPMRKVK